MDDFRDKDDSSKIILADETYAIVGVAMEVYYKLGTGFHEPVYQQALAIELGLRNIPFRQQERFEIEYKGHLLEKEYFADYFCYDQIIVEIKALNHLTDRLVAGFELFEDKQTTRRITFQLWKRGTIGMEEACDLNFFA